MPFEALLFDPSTKQSSRVTVRVLGSYLEVIGGPGGETLRVDVGKTDLTAGGWDRESLQISWPGPSGLFALSIRDGQAVIELGAVPKFQSGLSAAARARGRTRRHGGLGMAIVAAVTLLPLLLLLGLFLFRNQIVDAVLSRIPLSVDQEVGKMFEGQVLGSKDTLKPGEATRTIGLIVDRLRDASPAQGFDFKVSVQRNQEINAFAAPGGLMVVYTGLIKEAGSAEEVAGVLAHEMAHATRRHSMRQVIYAAGLLPLMGAIVGQPDAATLFQSLGQLSELKFSRAQEEDADRTGFDTLVAAGLSTDGMARFFDRLAKAGGTPPSFLSTHPSSTGRAAAIRAREKALGNRPTEPLPVDWEAVKASLP